MFCILIQITLVAIFSSLIIRISSSIILNKMLCRSFMLVIRLSFFFMLSNLFYPLSSSIFNLVIGFFSYFYQTITLLKPIFNLFPDCFWILFHRLMKAYFIKVWLLSYLIFIFRSLNYLFIDLWLLYIF